MSTINVKIVKGKGRELFESELAEQDHQDLIEHDKYIVHQQENFNEEEERELLKGTVDEWEYQDLIENERRETYEQENFNEEKERVLIENKAAQNYFDRNDGRNANTNLTNTSCLGISNSKGDQIGNNRLSSSYNQTVNDNSKLSIVKCDDIGTEIIKNLQEAKKDKTIERNEIAEYLVKYFKFLFYEGSLYVYEKPIYSRLDDHKGKTLIKTSLGKDISRKLSDYDLREILNQISTTYEIQLRKQDLQNHEDIICFRNCLYDVVNRSVIEPDHSYIFFNKVEVDFNPNNIGYGHNFENYLETCSGGDNEIKALILQVIGYIISNYTCAKKLFMLVGPSNSGKSTFGTFLESLLGKENTCNVEIQDLNKRFIAGELFGKKLCLNMELSDMKITDLVMIKQLTGLDTVRGERKYEQSFYFRNEAKLLFATNQLPQISNPENAEAFYKRLLIIPFNYGIPELNQDRDLIKKLIAESNYIIHRSLQALYKLIENNFQFVTCTESDNLKQGYIESCNSVIAFVNARCELDENSKIHTEDLFFHYTSFCEDAGYKKDEILNIKKFSNIISTSLNVKRSKWRNERAENKNGFIGLSIIEAPVSKPLIKQLY